MTFKVGEETGLKLKLVISVSVDGQWSGWNDWTGCSATCADGIRSRDRLCNNPSPQYNGNDCPGNSNEMQTCKLRECPGQWHAKTLIIRHYLVAKNLMGNKDMYRSLLFRNRVEPVVLYPTRIFLNVLLNI